MTIFRRAAFYIVFALEIEGCLWGMGVTKPQPILKRQNSIVPKEFSLQMKNN